MAERDIRANDQLVSRIVRQAISQFQNATTLDDKLAAVMLMASVSSVAVMSNRQYIDSTLKYVQGRLS